MEEINTRMNQLLSQVSSDDYDAFCSELISLESSLTIHELILLFKAANQDGTSPWEPIFQEMHHWGKDPSRWPFHSVVSLPELKLVCLAQQARLQSLGLLEMRTTGSTGTQLALTPKGANAVRWWMFALADEGFAHAEMNFAGDDYFPAYESQKQPKKNTAE